MRHATLVMAAYLFTLIFFWQKELILLTKDDFFYCAMRFIPKIALNTKKRPVKVTSTTFLFREVEQLAFYQL